MTKRNERPEPTESHPASQTQQGSAEFLVEEFDMPVIEAAELVTDDGDQKNQIEERAYADQRRGDDLEGEPTPEDPHLKPGEEVGHHMQKPVRHSKE